VYISAKLKFVTVVLPTSFGYSNKERMKGTIAIYIVSEFSRAPKCGVKLCINILA
jgi:hypothetical protein